MKEMCEKYPNFVESELFDIFFAGYKYAKSKKKLDEDDFYNIFIAGMTFAQHEEKPNED